MQVARCMFDRRLVVIDSDVCAVCVQKEIHIRLRTNC